MRKQIHHRLKWSLWLGIKLPVMTTARCLRKSAPHIGTGAEDAPKSGEKTGVECRVEEKQYFEMDVLFYIGVI
jgi:hypothetical protein